jgi:mannose-6-phosphate isomerase-like protein (cupin superfamily)
MAKTPAKKTPAARKTASKAKPAARTATAAKPAAKKTAARKPAAKKPAAKTTTAKKAAPKRATAKKAPARKAAAGKAPARKAPARKPAAAKAPARKAPARKAPARKPAPRRAAPRKALARTGAVARATKPAQRFAVTHHLEGDFKRDGLRPYANYRDLGFAAATGGLAQAHVIRLVGPCDPKEVSKLHYHDVDFQMVYVLKGWMKNEFEGQGEQLMRAGTAWIQPPGVKHKVLDYSDDCEVLEIILPAQFDTVTLEQ